MTESPPLAVYLHWPYCARICPYCDFNVVRDRGLFDSPQEIEETLNAAAAVGDDRIQQKTQGRVDPESFTHGTSAQRVEWFRRGFDSGDPNRCTTFSEVL